MSKMNDDPISKLLQSRTASKDDEIPCKMVRPSPGFVAKTHTSDGEKLFINICYTDDIPEPEDITDSELIDILESDEPSSFRVPMSIGNLHTEVDKSGNLCSAYDIAINSRFFSKIYTNELFQTFFLTVVMEGLQEKYSIELPLSESRPYRIVKNRKCLGTLQMHRIQIRPVKKNLIQEIPSYVSPYTKIPTVPKPETNKPLIHEIEKDNVLDQLKISLLDELIGSKEKHEPKNKPLIEETNQKTNKPLIHEIEKDNVLDQPKISLIDELVISKEKNVPKKKPLIEEISPTEYTKIKKQLKHKEVEQVKEKVKLAKKMVKAVSDEITHDTEHADDDFTEIEINRRNDCETSISLISKIYPELEDNHGVHPMAVDDIKKIRLYGIPNRKEPEKVIAFIKFKALSGNDICLNVSERRVIVTNQHNAELIDFKLPVEIDPEKTVANYCVNLQLQFILKVQRQNFLDESSRILPEAKRVLKLTLQTVSQ